MGKRLWRKQSFHVGVENDDPGCIWAFFQILRFHNVKRMLPYHHKRQKPPRKTSKRKVKPKHHQICPPYELEEAMTMSFASADLGTSVARLVKKKSVKAKIKALLAADKDKSKEFDLLQQSQLKVLEHNCKHLSAPTLISLLKANPKPIRTPKCIEESSKLEPKKGFGNKDSEEEVGVLEVFRVNQELFLKLLKDSPMRKPRLAKSRTFPSPNHSHIMLPSKVGHKHNEIWPIITHQLKESKSQRMGRSSSLKESLDRYPSLFQTKSNKEIKEGLSRSLKLIHEKEFTSLDYHPHQRSSKERLSFLEKESYIEAPQANLEALNLNQISHGELKGIKMDSPRGFEGLEQVDGLAKSHLSRQSNQDEEEQIAHMTTGVETHLLENGILNVGCSNPDDFPILSHRKCTFEDLDVNEELQYVKYVLDLMGFTAGEDPHGAWHSPDQPLDPALFDGIEVCCPFEPKLSNKKGAGIMSRYHRKVLFDLINEALVYVHERSYVCYPKALSYSCHVRPMPKGKNQVVEEVWEFMSQFIKWRYELDEVLNLAVPRDLSEDGPGWMNLQTDSECLALYMEDLIFDELLEEIIC